MVQRLFDNDFSRIIGIGNDQKHYRKGEEAKAFELVTRIVCGLFNAYISGRADGLKFFIEVDQNTRSRHNHPYYDILAVQSGDSVLRTVRPSLALAAYHQFHEWAGERSRIIEKKTEPVPYKSFESELEDFDLGFPEDWTLESGVDCRLWMTPSEFESFGTLEDYHANFGQKR